MCHKSGQHVAQWPSEPRAGLAPTPVSEARSPCWWGCRGGVVRQSPGQGPLTSGNHLNGHPDLVSPEPLEDLPEVAGPQLPAQREFLPGPFPVGTVGQGLWLVLDEHRPGFVRSLPSPSVLREFPLAPARGAPRQSSNVGVWSAWEGPQCLTCGPALPGLPPAASCKHHPHHQL